MLQEKSANSTVQTYILFLKIFPSNAVIAATPTNIPRGSARLRHQMAHNATTERSPQPQTCGGRKLSILIYFGKGVISSKDKPLSCTLFNNNNKKPLRTYL
jgi:hypothetical protein